MILLRLLIPIIALLGLLDSSYLTYEKFRGIIPPCSAVFDCESVLQSQWAQIGPIPLSLIGVGYYITVLILGSLYVGEQRSFRLVRVPISIFQLLRLISVFGFIFSLYFVFLMAVVIQSWCLYCLLSALISTLIAIIVYLEMIQRRKTNEDRKEYPLNLAFFSLAYRFVLKPILFQFNPEHVHNAFVRIGVLLGGNSITQHLTRWSFSARFTGSKTVAGIHFPNPVGLSAGFDYDADLGDILPDIGFGFATLGTVTLDPYEGNTRPMLTRFPNSKALLVNKGFKSIGAKAIIEKLNGKVFRIPIGISIGSTNKAFQSTPEQVDDVAQSFQLFEESNVGHCYYELNISCPNTKGGQPFTDVKRLDSLLLKLRKLKILKPVFVKLPIDLEDGLSETETHGRLLRLVERLSKEKWIVGVNCGNLTKDHRNLVLTQVDREKWKNLKGGVSGKPTFERSNALIRAIRKNYKDRFIIIGTGGIFSGEDAREKIKAGADLVQLITGMIYQGPQVVGEINWKLFQKD